MDASPFKRAPFPRSRGAIADLAEQVAHKYSRKSSKKYKLRPKLKNLIRNQAARLPPLTSYFVDFLLFVLTCVALWVMHSLEPFNKDEENKFSCAILTLLTVVVCEVMKVFLIAAFSDQSTVLVGRVELDILY
jgi:hypothetical protein